MRKEDVSGDRVHQATSQARQYHGAYRGREWCFQHDLRLAAMFAQQLVGVLPSRVLRRQGNEALAVQVARRYHIDRFQRMPWIDRQVGGIAPEGPMVYPRQLHFIGRQAQVELPRGDQVAHFGRHARLIGDRHRRMALMEGLEREWHQGGAERRQRRDLEFTRAEVANACRDIAQLIHADKRAQHFPVQQMGLAGRHQPTLDPVEQGEADRVFQLLDRFAHGGLRNAQHFGRTRRGLIAHHCVEGFDLTLIHGVCSALMYNRSE